MTYLVSALHLIYLLPDSVNFSQTAFLRQAVYGRWLWPLIALFERSENIPENKNKPSSVLHDKSTETTSQRDQI